MSEYDTSFAFISLKNAQKISGIGNEISIIEIHLTDLDYTDIVKEKIENKFLNKDLIIRDWKEINKSFWVVLSTERTVMFLILSLIIIVAAFNVITSLFILVKNKSKEIALLKTIGADSSNILRIFLLVGSIIGVGGTIIGAILGSIITVNLENIRRILNSLFNLNLFPSEFYYIDQIPTSIDLNEVLIIVLFSVFISILATIYPAYSASKLEIKRILNNA
jgi:lipoprotein-releasing system permease protein